MKNKKVLLVVERSDKAMDRAFSVLERPTKKYRDVTIISFPDFETLGRVITGARLELLNNIRRMKPRSIQELARLVKRDFKNVYQDVRLLAEFGLIELKDAGSRKSAAPKAKYSEIILAA
jgi:predicted transcriptional regulator